ncbi:MAG: hypothetical protein M3O26_21345 [Pseudomonadota bacterium]|nr:hypothetical protein [Pseudomonadota bacterium]
MMSLLRACGMAFVLLASGACQKSAVAVAPLPAPTADASPTAPFQLTASIQELMDSVIDPAADALWDSVSITQTRKGTIFHQPHSDEQWHEVRRRAIALIEGSNLLAMEGRKLVAPGSAVLDQGTSGVLSAEEGQKRLDSQHTTFVQFASALRDAGTQMLAAIDKKDALGMMNAGAAMDGVCESCHLTFWYPNQVIPPLPPDFGASKSAPKPQRIPLSP